MILADPKTHEEWLKSRQKGIGGSDAACVIGKSNYKSNVDLWREKTGIIKPPDISDKPEVEYGKAAEKYIRELFILDYPQYTVEYHEYRMYANDDYPFIFATLDGEITTETGNKGILEIKTTTIQNAVQWNEWDNNSIPNNYYVQVIHQLAATGYNFVILRGYIRYYKNERLNVTIRDYRIDRKDVENDIKYLIPKEVNFWNMVIKNKEPALILPEI